MNEWKLLMSISHPSLNIKLAYITIINIHPFILLSKLLSCHRFRSLYRRICRWLTRYICQQLVRWIQFNGLAKHINYTLQSRIYLLCIISSKISSIARIWWQWRWWESNWSFLFAIIELIISIWCCSSWKTSKFY
jgi:hypothetical protein